MYNYSIFIIYKINTKCTIYCIYAKKIYTCKIRNRKNKKKCNTYVHFFLFTSILFDPHRFICYHRVSGGRVKFVVSRAGGKNTRGWACRSFTGSVSRERVEFGGETMQRSFVHNRFAKVSWTN